MKKEELYEKFIPKDRDLDKIALKTIEDPEVLPYLLEGMNEKSARVKFGCFNTLVLISEKEPEVIYPYFDSFADCLNSDNKIIKLGGIKILSNLSRVDGDKKFDRIFDKYYSFISDPAMTAAANASKGSSIIAEAKPYLAERISDQLLKVNEFTYKTEECKNILIGHVISAFDKIILLLENRSPVLDFVKNNTDNPWNATRTKAQKFLKKYA